MPKHTPLESWLLRWLCLTRRRSTLGFTLIELLISVAIGSLIVGTLLLGVVELLQISQRESSRTETQRDTQLALDFMADELRQAIFVYDGDCLQGVTNSCPGIRNYIPLPTGATPVLAFWRLDELPQTLRTLCSTNAASFNPNGPAIPAALQGVPCLSRRMYTLVVYYFSTANPSNIWKGQARILRYELPQFNAAGQRTQGWADPTQSRNQFVGWPLDTNTPANDLRTIWAGTAAPAAPAVLVDFVDNPTRVAVGGTAFNTGCPASPTTNSLPDYIRSPLASVAPNSTSFYACVRGGGVRVAGVTTTGTNNPGAGNQSVALFLRGNAAGRPGVKSTTNILFDMQTVVLTRSGLGKSPQ